MKRTLKDLTPIKKEIRQKVLQDLNELTYLDGEHATINIDIGELTAQYLEKQNIEDPKWYITSTAYTKMQLLVQEHNEEIGWYGTVEKHANKNYIITDILVYPQHTSSATIEQDEDKMFDFEMSLTDAQINSKRMQGHSHVNMGTTPSHTDETFYSQLLTQVNDFFLVLIINKGGSLFTRFYDIENNVIYENLPIIIIDELGNNLKEWVDTELETKITIKHRPIYYKPPKHKYKKGGYNKYEDKDKDFYKFFGL